MTMDANKNKKIFNFNIKTSKMQIVQNNQSLRESIKENKDI